MASARPTRPEAPRGQGQGGTEQRAPDVESGGPEFESCLCHLAGKPGATRLIFLSLLPCLLMRLTFGQLAGGSPGRLGKACSDISGPREAIWRSILDTLRLLLRVVGGLRGSQAPTYSRCSVNSQRISPCPTVHVPSRPLARDEVDQDEPTRNISGCCSKPDGAASCQRMPAASESQHHPQVGSLMHFPPKYKPGPALGIPREGRCYTQTKS